MKKTALSVLLAASLLSPAVVRACGFHNYAPQPTLVDWLLESEDIVLARSVSGNPFRFEVSETLEGSREALEIPFLVDSTTRRLFSLDASSTVLFARDGSYGPWKRLAYVDEVMEPVLRTVMGQLSHWNLGGDADRFHYFATLLDHPDDRIHRLALRELDQADYSLLRRLDLRIEPSRLRARLYQATEAEFKPIRLLLIGLSGEPQLRDLLEEGVEASIGSEGAYLGAYATALIELGGQDAVTYLAANYLTNEGFSLLARELLIEAIALHADTEDAALAASIEQAIKSAVWINPSLAGGATRQFGARANWSLQDVAQVLLDEGSVLDAADKLDVSHYVAKAQEFTMQH
jgi:hypothetical protein